MWHDIQVAVRGLRKSPGFTITALVTLSLAIGANTTVFSLLNALVLRDVNVREPRSLVQVSSLTPPDALESGLLALDRERGNTQLLEDLFRLAHTFKGNASIVGTDAAIARNRVPDASARGQSPNVSATPSGLRIAARSSSIAANTRPGGIHENGTWRASTA